MKKLLALLLACLLICPAALADVDYLLEDSGLTLTVPDAMTEQEPEEDDDEDLLLACVNDDETLLMLIFCTEAEGLTLDDVQGTREVMDMLLAKKRASDRKSWLETKGNLAEVLE